MVTLDQDVSLLNSIRLGDQLAFKTLYQKYSGLLYVHAYKKLGDREVVKDIIQEVFLSLWEKRETLIVQGCLSTYLFCAVRYKVIDVISAKYTADKYRQFEPLLNTQSTPTDYLTRERVLTAIINKEVEGLPPRMREVFQLSRSQYLSHQEIARKLGITTQSVRSHIKNALRILRVNLGTVYPFIIFFFN